MKRKLNKLSIVMYVLAVIGGLFAIYALLNSLIYIGQMLSTGYISFAESFSDILTYIFQNSAGYIFYAVGFFFFGYVINILKPGDVIEEKAEADVEEENEIEVAEEAEEVVEVVEEAAEEQETAAEAE